MLFNSIEFYIFFPLVTTVYFLLPHPCRWLWLLAASGYFYMAFVPAYILILCCTILVDYKAGLWIEATHGRRRKLFLAASLIANIGMLAVFKYLGFLNANLSALAHWLDWNYPIGTLDILLPIGLSFHTFQSLAYTIEVYRGRQTAERHLGILALYVLFYPQLVAGPIERPQHLLPQLHAPHALDYGQVVDGLKLMAWGFFKKIVVADRLAHLVNPVYGQPMEYTGPMLLLATVAFAYQIYCDFSGYSDIALGAAQVMGFRLMRNFDRPYSAASVAEFWRRWHISLSSWFRDYVYIPLGGNRVTRWRWVANVMLTFLLSGLWHRANWTFVVWGGLHGLYLVGAMLSALLRPRLGRWLRVERWGVCPPLWRLLATFSLVSFAWIFFRAATLSDALYIATHLFSGYTWANLTALSGQLLNTLGAGLQLKILFPKLQGWHILLLILAQVMVLEYVQCRQHWGSVRAQIAAWPVWLRWPAYYGWMLNILRFGAFEQSKFIYFQF